MPTFVYKNSFYQIKRLIQKYIYDNKYSHKLKVRVKQSLNLKFFSQLVPIFWIQYRYPSREDTAGLQIRLEYTRIRIILSRKPDPGPILEKKPYPDPILRKHRINFLSSRDLANLCFGSRIWAFLNLDTDPSNHQNPNPQPWIQYSTSRAWIKIDRGFWN